MAPSTRVGISSGEHNVLADCHVHLYHVYDLDVFLDAALANFVGAAKELGLGRGAEYVLMLTESGDNDYFGTFAAASNSTLTDRWRVRRTSEPTSLIVERDDGGRLILIAGRQIAAREGLEVLALGTSVHHPDGQGFLEAIGGVLETGGLAVVPWGFGKWWMRRGRLVWDAVRSYYGQAFFLGDNGGRLRYGPPPSLFARARDLGVWTLSGSDPLPLRSQERRAGRYGCLLPRALGSDRPAAALLTQLVNAPHQPRCYGGLQPLSSFLAAQVAMQLRKHVTRSSVANPAQAGMHESERGQ